MKALIYLIPLTLILGGVGLLAFIWSVKNNQYDDIEGSGNRILFDEKNGKKDK